MDATQQPLNFPIEARFTVTEDIARDSESVLRDAVLPRWVQIALPLSVVLQFIAQYPKLSAGDHLAIAIGLIASFGAFYGLMLWRRRKKKKQAHAAMLGKQVAVRFFEDGLDFATLSGPRIGYSSIVRVGRDDRGLVVMMGRIGGLFIPTHAFASPEQRDLVFGHIGRALRTHRIGDNK